MSTTSVNRRGLPLLPHAELVRGFLRQGQTGYEKVPFWVFESGPWSLVLQRNLLLINSLCLFLYCLSWARGSKVFACAVRDYRPNHIIIKELRWNNRLSRLLERTAFSTPSRLFSASARYWRRCREESCSTPEGGNAAARLYIPPMRGWDGGNERRNVSARNATINERIIPKLACSLNRGGSKSRKNLGNTLDRLMVFR